MTTLLQNMETGTWICISRSSVRVWCSLSLRAVKEKNQPPFSSASLEKPINYLTQYLLYIQIFPPQAEFPYK